MQMQRYQVGGQVLPQFDSHEPHFYSDAHNNLGVIFYLLKNYGKAIKEYDTALKLHADSGRVLRK